MCINIENRIKSYLVVTLSMIYTWDKLFKRFKQYNTTNICTYIRAYVDMYTHTYIHNKSKTTILLLGKSQSFKFYWKWTFLHSPMRSNVSLRRSKSQQKSNYLFLKFFRDLWTLALMSGHADTDLQTYIHTHTAVRQAVIWKYYKQMYKLFTYIHTMWMYVGITIQKSILLHNYPSKD